MVKGVKYTGVISDEELESAPGVPTLERIELGPVAVIECVQEIPCNPCEYACEHQAISIGNQITSLPKLDQQKCIGCGKCIAKCPGLAIYRVHKNYSETTSIASFPYEHLPLPEIGASVECANREGDFVTKGKVIEIFKEEEAQRTAVITVEFPKEYLEQTRTILKRSL